MTEKIMGDLYSDCSKCGSVDTKYVGTEAGDPLYECKGCGIRFFPHMKFFKLPQRNSQSPSPTLYHTQLSENNGDSQSDSAPSSQEKRR